jgi:hypothetical protein
MEGETARTHTFSFDAIDHFEAVPSTFFLPGGVPVHAGEYRWVTLGGYYQTSQADPIVLRVEVACCDFYNGSSFDGMLRVNYRPNEYLETQIQYDYTSIDLPTGEVDIHVIAVDGTVNFTPDMQVALQAQFDNISESFGLLARYRWEFRPGSELLVAFGQSAVIPGTDFRFQTTQLSIRLGHTFRF